MVEPYIQTYTRRAFYVLDPRSTDVCIEDIAHQLSHQVRWTGAGKKWLSVAEHSVLASQWCTDYPIVALLHDAAEAYLPDLASPIKHDPRMQFYRDVEDKIMRAIFIKFNLDYSLLKEVKLVDTMLKNSESLQVLNRGPFWKKQIPEDTPKVKLSYWTPKKAEQQFLDRYEALTK